MIRAALLTPLFPPNTGGAAIYAELLAPRLAGDVALLVVTERCPGHPMRERVMEASGASYDVLRLLPRYSSVPASGLPKALRLALNRIGVIAVVLWLGIFRRAQVLHLHGQYARFGFGAPLAALARLMGVRTILDIRDLGVRGPALRHFDRVIAASRVIEDTVRDDVAPKSLRHIPVPHAVVPPAPLTDELPEHFFLFVGAIRESKGIDLLLEAYRRYRATRPDGDALVLIGEVSEPHLTRNARAIVLGPRSAAFVRAAMARTSLVLMPSRSEGLSRVCLEAIEAGARFVVGSGVPELEEACPRNVLRTITVEGLLACLHDPGAIPHAASYNFARHHPDAVAADTLRLYRELLAPVERTTAVPLHR